MSDRPVKVNITAEITIGSETEWITINSLSMTSCVARLTFYPKKFQPALLRLFEDKGEEGLFPFQAIKTTIESSSQKSNDPEAYYATIKFKGAIKANQGVIQIMHSYQYPQAEKPKVAITANNSSLRVTPVNCHMCGKKDIPFWALQSRTMVSEQNIFGVPRYTEALSEQQFCNYNLIRVVVCPDCLFASSDSKDFQKQVADGDQPKASFNKGAIIELWNEKLPERKKLLEGKLSGFFGEERSVDQAILSYDLAVITADFIFKADESKSPRARNYTPPRKAVSNMLFKAQLLMDNDRKQETEKILEEANARLEETFLYLDNEPSIKTGFLLGMLGLYLEDYKKVGHYLNFLRTYNQNDTVEKGTKEYKTLTIYTKKLNEAMQDREEFSKSKLKDFSKPY